MNFDDRYKKLNSAQKRAVDTVDGPVMVVAGPGTGKTELLSMRAANILKKTDALPENILCLTFTESGASAMRDRLREIIGPDSYKISVHTFHSFGTEVINRYGEFFYQGALFRPADEISRYEIMRAIFDDLDLSNPLNKKLNGEYTYLREAMRVIAELKRSGLTGDELLGVLAANAATIEKANQVVAPIFEDRISKKTTDELALKVVDLRESSVDSEIPNVLPLGEVLAKSLESALSAAEADNSTKPITAWRNRWFKRNEKREFELKSKDRQVKLAALSAIYQKYLSDMQEAELFDFDDMILRVVHAMEVFNELRFNLQEKYQYIMVDEFQDTNMAQMRILHNLTNSESHGDTPNILVVGDDDQAIYRFQGADISNILDFKTTYPKAELIVLTNSYRSGQSILDSARDLIKLGEERLENSIEELDKKLTAAIQSLKSKVELVEFEQISDERLEIVDRVKNLIADGVKPSEIAVLTRKHKETEELLNYFAKQNIPVQYERQDNALELEPVVLIEKIARVIDFIASGLHDKANELIPEIISHPAFGLSAKTIWQLSLKAFNNRTVWLEEINTSDELSEVGNWLVELAAQSKNTPLEQMIDRITGTSEAGPSPIYKHFFSQKALQDNPHKYIRYLNALRAIRTKLREYSPKNSLELQDFVEFVELYRKIGKGINVNSTEAPSDNAVHLMTAHSSKGLEFEYVFVFNSTDSNWGERARSPVQLISYPENLNLSDAGNNFDEKLRLFYVACTRAKKGLTITYSLNDDSGRVLQPASFLSGENWKASKVKRQHDGRQLLENNLMQWHDRLVEVDSDLRQILKPTLVNYQLSVTHFNNFLDVSRGGPQEFLMQNLLHFPQSMPPAAAYGSAVHEALQQAHSHLSSTGKIQPAEDILRNFESSLKLQRLAKKDFDKYLKKGTEDLRQFFDVRLASFSPNQKPELNFKYQNVVLDDARLSGKLDLLDLNGKEVTVTDYKTGKPSRDWKGKDENEKIKLHKYRQQLLFYKLLVENSKDYSSKIVSEGKLEYVEPDKSGEIVSLSIDYDQEEVDRLALLIKAVWRKIMNVSLPDVSNYKPNLKGLLEFEQDLIDEKV